MRFVNDPSSDVELVTGRVATTSPPSESTRSFAASLAGLTPRAASIHFPGGTLQGEWTDETVFLTGPAERSYGGVVDTDELLRVWRAAR